MSGRCYLIAGGGTGGHLFPGIAVAERLLERDPGARILFVGSDRAIERDVLATTPFEHCVLPAVSLSGAMRHPLRFVSRSMGGYRAASRLLAEMRPDVVIGCGGFASAAPVLAAARRGVPVVLLEQNVIPGRTTRWLSRLGGTICLTFEQTQQYLHRSVHCIVTGNPVRRAIANLATLSVDETRMLLVLGGSQGAASINRRMREFTRREAMHNSDRMKGWRIVHQTGSSDEASMGQFYHELGVEALVAAFFDDTPTLYRQASLIISRAGATTLAELACAGVPAILLPYPHAADNHQWHNADVFQSAGAAIVVDDHQDGDIDSVAFAQAITSLLDDQLRRENMSASMRGLARPDAAARVCDVIAGLIGQELTSNHAHS